MSTVKAFVAVVLLAACDNPDDGPNAKRSGQEPSSDPTLSPGAMRGGQAPLGMSGSGSPDSGTSPTSPTNPASLTDTRMPNSPSQPDAGPTGSILDALLGTIDARPADTGLASPAVDARPMVIKSFATLIPKQVYFLTTKDQIAELSIAKGVFIGCMVEANMYDPTATSRYLRIAGLTDQVIPLRLATLADVSRLKYPTEDFPADYFAKMYGGPPEAMQDALRLCP